MSRRANGEGTVYQRKDGRWIRREWAAAPLVGITMMALMRIPRCGSIPLPTLTFVAGIVTPGNKVGRYAAGRSLSSNAESLITFQTGAHK